MIDSNDGEDRERSHDMTAKDVIDYFNNKEKFSDEAMDSIESAQKFADIIENRSLRDDL